MLFPGKLSWQLFLFCFTLIVLSVLILSYYFFHSVEEIEFESQRSAILTTAQVFDQHLHDHDLLPGNTQLQSLCVELGRKTNARFTVILPDGKVLCDSDEDPQLMDNHRMREEVQEALKGHTGYSVRHSPTTGILSIYIAIPHLRDQQLLAVTRVAVPYSRTGDVLAYLYTRILILAGLIIAVSAVVCFWISRRITKPLWEMKIGAEKFAHGELGNHLLVSGPDEVTSLSLSLNEMANQLDDRIRTVLRQRNELEAVLSSMVEGVLAIDRDDHIISLNRAAAEILGLDAARVVGKSIQESIRNADLLRFVSNTLASEETSEGEIVLRDIGECYLQAHGTRLRDSQGQAIGVVVVLNDVTRMKRLEAVRRDFVANVSHEIRTPITSIKGFVETLQDGAIDNPAEARQFLEIMARQADRLNSIINDLLSLSRIEQEREKNEIPLELGDVGTVLKSAIQVCGKLAEDKDIRLRLDLHEELKTHINPALLEQAVVNLVDNAIKYSSAGSEVYIEGHRTSNEITITVRDQGCGIPKDHLPRIFERFYRVDKARSRKLGGTGLGLAIVKHIIQAHHGNVTVTSTIGQGSVFTIHLPLN